MSDKYLELDSVLETESWEWLDANFPPLADSVAKAVGKGISPEDIRRRVVLKLGAHREALAQRCELAAKHLERSK
jgi:hypothetical protein